MLPPVIGATSLRGLIGRCDPADRVIKMGPPDGSATATCAAEIRGRNTEVTN